VTGLCIVTRTTRLFPALVLLEQVDGSQEDIGGHRFLAVCPSLDLRRAYPKRVCQCVGAAERLGGGANSSGSGGGRHKGSANNDAIVGEKPDTSLVPFLLT
jgi:hypothetical protein